MVENKFIKIKKRDGRLVDWDQSKITNAIFKALTATDQDPSRADELSDKVVLFLNQRLAGGIPGVEQIQDMVEEVLSGNGLEGVAKAYHTYREKRSEIREAKWWLLNYSVKTKLSHNALRVLESRYLKKNDEGKIIETPQELFKRVAQNIASAEKIYNPNMTDEQIFQIEEKFYHLMASLDFLPNSPTLMNAGNVLQQLSACFVLPVPDSMEGIFDAIKNGAIIHQSGGGTGYSFARLRPKGDIVKSTKGVASGPISFMTVFDAATQTIKQGGKRRGANMGILRVNHPDIMEFITAKHQEGILSNFNISVSVTDEFMNKARKGEEYDLINPRTGQIWGKLNAKNVFDLIVHYAWQTGDPGVIFIDRINQYNPTPRLGDIESTNPCVTGDTLVSTENGLERMEKLYERYDKEEKFTNIFTDNRTIPQQILMQNKVLVGSGQVEDKFISLPVLPQEGVTLRHTTKYFNNGIKPVMKLTTECGYEIKATLDHKFLTPNGWIRLKDLEEGDVVYLQSGEGSFSQNKKLSIDFTKINKYRNHYNLPLEWSNELGQVLGWLSGDGWLRDGDKDCRVGFTFSEEDKEVLYYLKPILNKWYGQDIKEVKRENGVYHLSYHGKGFVEFFKQLGVMSVDGDKKAVPESIFTASKEAAIGYLQGLFSADGTASINEISHTNYIRLTSKSKKLLQESQLLLLNLNIKSKIYNRSRKPRYLFPYINKKGEKKIYLSDGICFELHISRDNIKKFIGKINFLLGKHKNRINKLTSCNFLNDKFVDKIAKIKPCGKEIVYDLTEPVTSSLDGNGFVLHNCGEQPLLPFESCNLGSINLVQILKEKDGGKWEIDWQKLKETVSTAVRFLDNVVEVNRYPLPQIEEMTKGNRKVGLGVMGFADMLIKLEIPYNSKEALDTAEKVMKFIQEESKAASFKLAESRGAFFNFKSSIYDKDGSTPIRNATTTTIAPTGTIGIIANCSSGIEPIFTIAFVRKHVLGGQELVEVNPVFEEIAKKRGFYSKELIEKISGEPTIQNVEEIPADVRRLFVTAFDITPEDHVRIQAAFQKYSDNAVSKTINFSFEATEDDVRKAYFLSFDLGCKGVTVFRNGSRQQQVLNIKPKEQPEAVLVKEIIKEQEVPPELRDPSPYVPDLPPGACPTCNV